MLFRGVYDTCGGNSQKGPRLNIIPWSPRWDLNPRPKVYETLTLPAELLGLWISVEDILFNSSPFEAKTD